MALKLIFVTGGVLSGLGKGVVTASLGLLLKASGLSVTAIKIDPYVNVDAGTMNPYMHGEVFVTEDGGETDLDLGHYERFLNINLSKKNNITTGKVYSTVIRKERKGEYLGQTVQIIPHVTDEIKKEILDVAREQETDVAIVEIGGTVGDIEGLPFLEAARQLRLELGETNTLFAHVVLVPKLTTTGELKTKPAQHSIQELRRIGIQPDILIARSPTHLSAEARKKLSLFGNVPERAIFSDPDVETVYEVPLVLHRQRILDVISDKLRIKLNKPDLTAWKEFVERVKTASEPVRIGMIGKYTKLRDSYLSIIEALKHASAKLNLKPILKWFEATDIERGRIDPKEIPEDIDCAVVLPGFGKRGLMGKIKAVKELRESGKPVLGICFGLQVMVVEFARNVLGYKDANSTEIDPNTPYPVVDLMDLQRNVEVLGGTMRLGARLIKLVPGTLAHKIYGGTEIIFERHRHRYQVNPDYIDEFQDHGFIVSGTSDDCMAEIMELKDSKFYLGTQAHPEFKSRPLSPSPVFEGLLIAASRK